MTGIYLHNTLTRKKERLVPAEQGIIKMYVCGPTTYNYIHLGNARPMVVFDTIRRYLEYRGYDVTYVQNFTDIDDKIINRAKETGEDPLRLSKRYVAEFHKDAHALNVKRADLHPLVSEHLPEIIEAISGLIEKGVSYEVEGNVFFSVRSFPDYGKLSGRTLDEMVAGARVEVDSRKRDPLDFALWKAARLGEPSWDSPWGKGRPGWHIECSTMARDYLGDGFDIHGGGFDLIFPHHENEIAQAEALHESEFCRYWLHNGMITVKEEKMSKSLGNFFLLRDVLEHFPGDVVRYYLLSTHYRSPLDFDYDKLEVARKGLERIKTSYSLLREVQQVTASLSVRDTHVDGLIEKTVAEFNAAMDDDFNTALAFGVIFDLCRETNSYLSGLDHPTGGSLRDLARCYEQLLGGVLGLELEGQEETVSDEGLAGKLMQILIAVRQEARQNKDWKVADGIRDSLSGVGIILEDTQQGVRWKRK